MLISIDLAKYYLKIGHYASTKTCSYTKHRSQFVEPDKKSPISLIPISIVSQLKIPHKSCEERKKRTKIKQQSENVALWPATRSVADSWEPRSVVAYTRNNVGNHEGDS